jgi:hypothetical protein
MPGTPGCAAYADIVTRRPTGPVQPIAPTLDRAMPRTGSRDHASLFASGKVVGILVTTIAIYGDDPLAPTRDVSA